MDSPSLPIAHCLDRITGELSSGRAVILRAPPGAGKTTGVPPAILKTDVGDLGQVLMLQPRRLAARAAAVRLSSLIDERPGQTYGYHVRFDRQVSKTTKFVSMTSGILLRQLASDPLLENVGCVIIDEFHERSVEVDLILGMLQRIRTTLRPELRLLVMSATLDTAPIESLIDDSVVVQSEGRAFDVAIKYDQSLQPVRPTANELADRVANVLPQAIQERSGDILVFLPGVGEIVRTQDRIDSIARKAAIDVLPLYGDLPPDRQDAVLAPSDRRKIVLATNVAETSITIPGVQCVIDTGLARQTEFDTGVGLSKLIIKPISQASADQRAGRAGRTAPGTCFRLWPKQLDRSRPAHNTPEILRTDLSTALLHLAGWGEKETFDFPWVTPPNEAAVELAQQQLRLLDAIDDHGRLTTVGEQLLSLPLHPRLGRLMISAVQWNCVEEAALAAAILSERDPFQRTGNRMSKQTSVESDLFDRLVRLTRFLQGGRDDDIHRGASQTIARVARQILQQTPSAEATSETSELEIEERLSRALLTAYPDRLARRRSAGSNKGLMVGKRGVQLDAASSVRTSEFFLCLNVDGKGSEAKVRLASAVDPAWFPSHWAIQKTEKFFHPTMKSVVARDRHYILDLLINENPCSTKADADSAQLLFSQANSRLNDVLPNEKALQSYLARWRFLDEYASQDSLPLRSSDALETVLRQLCQSCLSFKELQNSAWLDHLRGLLTYEQQQWIDRNAPESIEVPSGNRIRLTYEPGKPPVLAVRIQEIFGWQSAPKLAGGSINVQLHLLGPNHRPQQITDDLESFWKTTYIEVKKELKRRYPKHHWPDEPATSQATPNGLKPRSK
ncbi:ATP-dependent helicase HrpB [Stieleria sp. JC731]|uniref:ATP-dependent helicase HrpB n=1 Tax=Pirellulaceae TaxID=2691357 RepID=UPI001E58F09B|nr:ATP-dependent helicase HrpB [Stieleria sp. JC731]MCC9601365.1 ATP-dependent helicase HrpB [Stieleria sp. JC731]